MNGVPPYVFVHGDLPNAYDTVLHPFIAKYRTHRVLPKFFTAAVIRETRRQKVTINMGDVASDPLSRTKSLCEGSSDAPRVFNHIDDKNVKYFVVFC